MSLRRATKQTDAGRTVPNGHEWRALFSEAGPIPRDKSHAAAAATAGPVNRDLNVTVQRAELKGTLTIRLIPSRCFLPFVFGSLVPRRGDAAFRTRNKRRSIKKAGSVIRLTVYERHFVLRNFFTASSVRHRASRASFVEGDSVGKKSN